MSLDYPNRNKWLVIREERNRKREPKYSHVSAPLKMVMDGKSFHWVVSHKSKHETFTESRNQAKREVGKGWHRIGGYKTNTKARMELLADRRLRQRQAA